MSSPFDLPAHTHYLVIAGSRSHGLHTPESDVDLKGIALPPRAQLLGLEPGFEQCDRAEDIALFTRHLRPEEVVAGEAAGLEGIIYGLHKFARLASAANPNLLEALFVRDEELRYLTPVGAMLREHRELFLSARCLQTFSGYATQQLGRITRHHRWHHDGPSGAPERADFDLPERTLLPRSHLEAAESAIRKQLASWEPDLTRLSPDQRIEVTSWLARVLAEMGVGSDDRWASAARTVGLGDDLIEILKRERGYRAARDEWRRYQGWLKNRNPARAALEATHGYDTKHGAHLVRLLRMGREIATQGRCIVWRQGHDADELRAIRHGAWSYEQLVDWAEQQGRALRNLAASQLAVPTAPDADAIRALVLQCVETDL